MLRKERIENVAKKRRTKPFSLDLAWWNNNIQRRCSLDLVSPNNDTNRVNANKRKVCYKKRNPSSLDPVWTTIAQIHVKKQNYITKKKTFLCLTWSVRTMICMQILKRDPEETFFFLAQTEETWRRRIIFFSHKKPPHLTWSVQTTNWCWGLGPARAPADQFSAEQKGPDFL